MLAELRKVIPAFLTRVDQPERGGRWSAYLADTRDATADDRARGSTSDAPSASRADEVTLDGFRSRRRSQGRRGRALRVVVAAGRGAAGAGAAHVARPSARPCCAAYVGDRAQSAPQARPRVRAHELPVRRAHRLRRVSRSAAASVADDRLAGAVDRVTATRSRRRSSRPAATRTGARSWTDRPSCTTRCVEAGSAGRRAVRRVDGVSRAVRDGHERARGDARDRAAHGAAGASGVPARVPADAPADRRTSPAITRSPAAMRFADHSDGRARAAAGRAPHSKPSGQERMTLLLRHRLAVRFRDCDPLGHVNNAVYLTYLEQARFTLWRAQLGFVARTRPRRRAARRGVHPGACRDRLPRRRRGTATSSRCASASARIGRTSFTYDYEIVDVGHGRSGRDSSHGPGVVRLRRWQARAD